MSKIFLITIGCIALLAGGAWGDSGIIYCVDPYGEGTYTDLQAALNDAKADSDVSEIRVVRGEYDGNFSYHNPSDSYAIILKGGYAACSNCSNASRVLDPTNTILDGLGTDRVLYIYSSAGDNIHITIEGFTVRNGSFSNGGGITAVSYADSTGDITIANNIISDNNVASGYGGGVLAILSTSTGTAGNITLTDNIITGNSAAYNAGVQAISEATSSGTAGNVTLVNNIVAGNIASESTGGVLALSEASSGTPGAVTLTNNTVTGNSAATSGGGVFLQMGTNRTVDCYNNIIWGNTAPSGGDIRLVYSGGTATSSNNNYASMFGTWDNESDRMNLDPRLSGNYHLRSASPCIDKGNNDAPSLPLTDIDGDNRKIDGDKDDTATVDIGADEYPPKGSIANILLQLLN